MTSPSSGVRLLLVAPSTHEDAAEVARAVAPYRPSRAYVAPGVAPEVAAALATATALAVEPHGTSDAAAAEALLEAAGRAEAGACVLLAVPPKAMGPLMAHALGASPSAAARFTVVTTALSVLENDADGRWAVVRVNEGAYPDPS